jgi:hypothetical protein
MSLRLVQGTTALNETIGFDSLTVLVGPNNCGKSQTLRDLRSFITTGSTSRLKSLIDVSVQLPPLVRAYSQVERVPEAQSPNHVRTRGVSYDLQTRHEFVAPEGWIEQMFSDTESKTTQRQILEQMGNFWVAHLDAKGRFNLTAPTDAYDTRTESPGNALQKFYRDRAVAQPALRAAFKEAFGIDIALDWAAMKRWYLRVAGSFGEIPETNAELDALLHATEQLEEQGDGYKSFAGVALAVLTFADRVLLLDEPEAFLHPTQARVLGRWLAGRVTNRSGQVVVATHSADFLWGVLSANTDATVIRLNRDAEGTRYRPITPGTTAGLIQSPLLSSQPVLDALFHKGVVVCEGDPDRSVYQTVAHKLLQGVEGEEVLFIHTNGKDAAKGPVQLLRDAGTPVCVVVDIDVLNSAEPLASILLALTSKAPAAEIESLRQTLAAIVEQTTQESLLNSLVAAVRQWLGCDHSDLRTARKSLVNSAKKGMSKWDKVKMLGSAFFVDQGKNEFESILEQLALLGVFVVPCGELENWIRMPASKGQRWNRAALELLHRGTCPDQLASFVNRMVAFVIPRPLEQAVAMPPELSGRHERRL